MTAETRRIMRRWLWADYMLYDHFKAKMEVALDNYDILPDVNATSSPRDIATSTSAATLT